MGEPSGVSPVAVSRRATPPSGGPGRGAASLEWDERASHTPSRTAAARVLFLATMASVVAAAVWVVSAAATASHGLDYTDEGFYLLSYRWWDSELRTFTGVQFLYGPVFELLGHDIAALRLVRLLTIIAANAAFGWTCMRWLRLRRPNAPATRWWEAAGAAAILACGGMSYSWLPLSPGYNDVSLLGSLLAAAVVLKMAADVDRGRPVPFWVPLSMGPVAFAMLLAKWASSGLTLVVIAGVALVVMWPAGMRQIARVTAWALFGLLLSVVAVQLFVIRLDVAIPQLVATTRLVAAGLNNPETLALKYWRNLGDLTQRTTSAHAPLLVTMVGAVILRDRISSWLLAAVSVAAAALSFWALLEAGAFTGGNLNIKTYSVGLTLVLALALIAALGTMLDRRRPRGTASSLRSEGWRGAAVIFLLLALPLTQAAGTGNPFYFMSFNAFSAWAALMILILTGIEGAPAVARGLTAVATAGAVLISTAIGTNALWFHPYRTPPPSASTEVATGVPALRSLTLAPKTAAIAELRQVLEPYLAPGGGTYMMAFDAFPGVILALDGRSVGEAWYSNIDRARTAAGIRASCPDGKGPWGSRPPILMFNRAVSGTEISALRACGLDFARDYRQVEDPRRTMGYTVYVGATALDAHGNGAR